jgi:TPR repeat protein
MRPHVRTAAAPGQGEGMIGGWHWRGRTGGGEATLLTRSPRIAPHFGHRCQMRGVTITHLAGACGSLEGFMRTVAAMGLVAFVVGIASLSILPAKAQSSGGAPQPSRVMQEAPLADCDTYAASDFDARRNTKGIPYGQLNPALAIPACESAVRQYPNSQRLSFQLGRAYSKSGNFVAALQQFRKAAEQGYPMAEYNLGLMYENGEGVAKDYAEAAVWFRKAAEQGNALAQNSLGTMYAYGQGISENFAEAMKWYRKAADQGNARAQNNLAAVYANGQGAPKNDTEAVKWYRKAADQGDTSAQTSLGRMYENGQGVSQNSAEAMKWWRKAAEQGNAEAFAAVVARSRTPEPNSITGRQADQSSTPKVGAISPQLKQQATGAPFVVAIETSVSGGARPIVTGKTNLPDGTRLFTWLKKPWLPNAKERLAIGLTACGDDDCRPLEAATTVVGGSILVKNGQFSDGPFTDKGAALRPGTYVLEIWVLATVFEPPDVRAIIGQRGENMIGPLVGGCCFADPRGPAEIQKTKDFNLESEKHGGGASIYYARYVEIGPASPTPTQDREQAAHSNQTAQPQVPQVGEALKTPEKVKIMKCIQIMANQSPQPPGRPPTFAECQQILEQAKLMECKGVKVYQDPQPPGHPPTAGECQHILKQATRPAQTKPAGNPAPQKPSAYVENWTTSRLTMVPFSGWI